MHMLVRSDMPQKDAGHERGRPSMNSMQKEPITCSTEAKTRRWTRGASSSDRSARASSMGGEWGHGGG
eukprot:1701226-Prymnesium_polylepis.1